MSTLPPLRSWLYAPGDKERLLARVFNAGADAVILDLEDGVSPEDKPAARRLVHELVSRHAGRAATLFVRINHPRASMLEADLAAAIAPGLTGVRVPKVESRLEVAALDDALTKAERSAGIAAGGVAIVCGVESARGVVAAAEIAGGSPRVAALSFGVADYLADIGGRPTGNGVETLFARSQLVIASRLAGLVGPVDSVHPDIDDDEGLRRSSREGRSLGFSGRGAIHPRQVPIINAAYTPSSDEVSAARAMLAAAGAPDASGAFRMPTGEFVDAAIIRRAHSTLDLAGAIRRHEQGAEP